MRLMLAECELPQKELERGLIRLFSENVQDEEQNKLVHYVQSVYDDLFRTERIICTNKKVNS